MCRCVFCVVSVVCGCVLCTQCMFCVRLRGCVSWFCVCSVCVGWWFRAMCGPSQCSAPWGCQGGRRAASGPERPQMGSEACGEGTVGHMRVYGAGMGEAGGTQGVMRHVGSWETLQELWGIQESNVTPKGSGYWGKELGAHPGDQGDPGGVMGHPGELWNAQERGVYGAQERSEAS